MSMLAITGAANLVTGTYSAGKIVSFKIIWLEAESVSLPEQAQKAPIKQSTTKTIATIFFIISPNM